MRYLLVFLLQLSVCLGFSQEISVVQTQKVWRVNILNPGLELELPTSGKSTFSANLGIGYGGSYPDLSFHKENGFVYLIAPFLDLQEKWYYNFEKRIAKNKSVRNNSGNFLSARLLIRGHALADNFDRTSDLDFAVGPTWGIQRVYGKNFHLLFDVGPIYYFDGNGNGNFFPLMLQLNLGFDL